MSSPADTQSAVAVTPLRGALPFRRMLSLFSLAVVIAGSTFAVRQYLIGQDRIEGENTRLNAQVQEMKARHDHEDGDSPEQQKAVAMMLKDSLAKNPGDTSLYVPLGSALIAIGDTVGAIDAYKKYAVEINPGNLGAQTDYGYLQFIAGQRAEGRARTLAVLKKEPKNQIAMYNLAAMSFKENDIATAIEWMKRCVAADTASQMATMASSALEQLRQQRDAAAVKK